MASSKQARTHGLDWCINWCFDEANVASTARDLGREALWDRVGTILLHRQLESDFAVLAAVEDAGLVEGVWPEGVDQALDWKEVDWEDGIDLD